MDDYFALSGDDDDDPNDKLLDGITETLRDAATDALSAVDTMKGLYFYDDAIQWGSNVKQDIRQYFLDFSEADIDPNTPNGLQSIIDGLHHTWGKLDEHSDCASDLEHARTMLDPWRGPAADDAKFHLTYLKNKYQEVKSQISVLESDVVAGRELVGKARNDLINLSSSFNDAAKEYKRAKEAAQISVSDVLSAAFAGAVTGLLTVDPALGAVAAGVTIAKNVAGSLAVSATEHQKIEGKHPAEIWDDYRGGIEDIKKNVDDAADELVHKIDELELPKLKDPPDVSPGKTFDPNNFGTPDMPKETENRVRHSGKDIPRPAADGGQSDDAQGDRKF
ncbi:hypothetical protein GCM10022222_31940 [Amycolatopsis ultiminotia]|uniref:WXG100 family type VII secretion target n=1 Tax=Amycolatopsis ultiminotia TaxID=543629 RepID=A0ABP6W3H8_9PSEU